MREGLDWCHSATCREGEGPFPLSPRVELSVVSEGSLCNRIAAHTRPGPHSFLQPEWLSELAATLDRAAAIARGHNRSGTVLLPDVNETLARPLPLDVRPCPNPLPSASRPSQSRLPKPHLLSEFRCARPHRAWFLNHTTGADARWRLCLTSQTPPCQPPIS